MIIQPRIFRTREAGIAYVKAMQYSLSRRQYVKKSVKPFGEGRSQLSRLLDALRPKVTS